MNRCRTVMRCVVLIGAATIGWACTEAPTEMTGRVLLANEKAPKFWDVLATTRWNGRATDFLQGLAATTPSNGQAWASRMLTYLSLAQYRAVLAARAPADRPTHASTSAAVARASFDVLTAFFASAPGVSPAMRQHIVDQLAQQYLDDQSAPGWPGQKNEDVAAGNAIGVAVAQGILAQSAQDGYLSRTAPTPPTGPSYWFATGPIVRSLWGATPFFLEPQDLLLSPPPPVFDSPEFVAAAHEVYAIVTVLPLELRAEQVAIANKWNKVAPNGPFTAGEWNRTADDLIRSHHRTEAEAAHILAYANAAAFDAQIDCFTTKFNWWVRRPAQVDSRITPFLAFSVPNHPSYPSGHSCISSAFAAMLSDAFPSERSSLDELVVEAGMSRIYAGIHYRFDIEAGQGIGRRAAAMALAGSLDYPDRVIRDDRARGRRRPRTPYLEHCTPQGRTKPRSSRIVIRRSPRSLQRLQ